MVPVFNEREVLPLFHEALSKSLGPMALPHEIIYVNDGSIDESQAVLEGFRKNDASVRILELSRNFGHQSAMAAGLDHARGDACVIMDADMQDPPTLIPEMVRLWREGAEVVYAVRRTREGETWFKRLTAKVFYRALRRLSGVDIPIDTGDFRLMDRVVVDALCRLPERTRFLRGLVAWAGFRQVGLPFDRPTRALGETKFPLRRMLGFAVDGITSFSHVPLRVVTFLGLGSASLSLGITAWALYVRLATDRSVPGWTSQIIAALFLGGVQMLALGILGEYIARIFDESKHRPLYLVRRFHSSEDR